MMYGWEGFGGGWFPGMMGAMGLLWIVVLILVVVFLVRYLARKSDWETHTGSRTNRHGGPHRGPGAGSDGENALNILRERYARGEIGREEYERIRNDLMDHRDIPPTGGGI